MSRARNHHGYYVTAIIDGGTANQRTSWLMGPFQGPRAHMEAMRMVEPVRRAVNRHSDDPRFAFAAFGTAKMTLPRDRELPAGRFDMTWCDDDYMNDVINASIK
jgi:hypothetical protein